MRLQLHYSTVNDVRSNTVYFIGKYEESCFFPVFPDLHEKCNFTKSTHHVGHFPFSGLQKNSKLTGKDQGRAAEIFQIANGMIEVKKYATGTTIYPVVF
jgi:hypothetical protein